MKTSIEVLEEAMCDAWGGDVVSELVGTELSWVKEFTGKWISVKDKLPPKTSKWSSDYVLTLCERENFDVAFYDYEFMCFSGSPYRLITHWMELPPKPKNK